ncbi:MAG: helix-turn-helix domain-containing protein [Firmicutes bacterium]|nr:helix-turn-helix domain-containing protein [Bacillota bacterium]MCL5058595.1 helix-turn-helix domain-containing protein [Actinomycetota bacterium]
MFLFGIKGKTVKELRKNRGLTARELAFILKIDTVEILKIDKMKLKDIPDPLKTKITPVLRGDDLDKIPWL